MKSMALTLLVLGLSGVLCYVYAEAVKRTRTLESKVTLFSRMIVPFPMAIGMWGWMFALTLAYPFEQSYGLNLGLLVAVITVVALGLVGLFFAATATHLSKVTQFGSVAGFAAALLLAEMLLLLAMHWQPAPRWNLGMLCSGALVLLVGGLGLSHFSQVGALDRVVRLIPLSSSKARPLVKLVAKLVTAVLLGVVLSSGLWLVLGAAVLEGAAQSQSLPPIQPEWLGSFVGMVILGLMLVMFCAGVLSDRTEERVGALARELSANHHALQEVRETDLITRLPNRSTIEKHLHQRIAEAVDKQELFAVFYVGLDAFRQINESLGFHSGDGVLAIAASRIQQAMGAHDLVARAGGDEFIIVAKSCNAPAGAVRTSEHLLALLSRAYGLPGQEVSLTASVGIALYPQDGRSPNELLSNANFAMSSVKKSGRNHFRFFSSDMASTVRSDFLLQGELREALSKGRLEMFFQPQFDLRTMLLVGCEGLVRWRLPDGKIRMPDQFIGLAERTGLIIPLGNQVLGLSCAAARRWHGLINRWIQVGVNVSAIQFQQPDFVDNVARVIEASGIWPRALVLEVTESTAMTNAESTLYKFEQLHAMGVNISIDDFGTGYSSLAYLKRFSFHHIKIDRAFVRDLSENRVDQHIVKAVIDLSHNFGVQAVAEGVESEAQHQLLCTLGCGLGQGYLYGRPVAEQEFVARFLLPSDQAVNVS